MERKQKEEAPRLTERIELRVTSKMMAEVEARAVRDKMSIADVVRAALSGIEETRK